MHTGCGFGALRQRATPQIVARKGLAKGVEDEDIMFARPGPTVEYWEGEDLLRRRSRLTGQQRLRSDEKSSEHTRCRNVS
jgi:hypothetical protein